MTKLSIKTYKDISYGNSAFVNEITLQVNPDNYKVSKKIDYGNRQSVGAVGQPPKFKKYTPSTVSFETILDGTGIIPLPEGEKTFKTVTARIKEIESALYKPGGTENIPHFALLAWGTFLFKGILTSMDYTFTLFTPDGNPLRAKVNLNFTEAVSVEMQTLATDQLGNDLGKLKTVSDSEPLPEMCNKQYGTPNAAADVAAANNFNGFRNIPPGTPVVLPKMK